MLKLQQSSIFNRYDKLSKDTYLWVLAELITEFEQCRRVIVFITNSGWFLDAPSSWEKMRDQRLESLTYSKDKSLAYQYIFELLIKIRDNNGLRTRNHILDLRCCLAGACMVLLKHFDREQLLISQWAIQDDLPITFENVLVKNKTTYRQCKEIDCIVLTHKAHGIACELKGTARAQDRASNLKVLYGQLSLILRVHSLAGWSTTKPVFFALHDIQFVEKEIGDIKAILRDETYYREESLFCPIDWGLNHVEAVGLQMGY